MDNNDLITLTADITSAYVANNQVEADKVGGLVGDIHRALSSLGMEEVRSEPQEPAVPIRSSVKPDYIVCLEDGRKLKMLKRHLRTTYDMSPEEYRSKWGLPSDYPLVAPNYAAKRRELAKKIGLGTNPNQKRGRKSSSKAAKGESSRK